MERASERRAEDIRRQQDILHEPWMQQAFGFVPSKWDDKQAQHACHKVQQGQRENFKGKFKNKKGKPRPLRVKDEKQGSKQEERRDNQFHKYEFEGLGELDIS